eukprot:CAMPEP_0171286254 /NCGR_PEP_ID=MMETSP0790-20130122/68914_1 /TAXON_ID=2925 /ORGANISM="Alexandrium catenella, Strain OF101" /LENGTH=241 /DNA_ID=CAMNT_0011755685 /DNA_START=134 /DNA_END=857 /DNA_ORIENTATION=+
MRMHARLGTGASSASSDCASVAQARAPACTPPEPQLGAGDPGLGQISDELTEGLPGHVRRGRARSQGGVHVGLEGVAEQARAAPHVASGVGQRHGVEMAYAVLEEQLEGEEELHLPGLHQAEEAQQQGPQGGPQRRLGVLEAEVGRRNVHGLLQGEEHEGDEVGHREDQAERALGEEAGGREPARQAVAAASVVRGHRLGRLGEEDLHQQRGEHLQRKDEPAPPHRSEAGVPHERGQLQRE